MKDRPVTLKDVARIAGVYPSTSLAMHGHPSIPAATCDRICTLADRMGYWPRPMVVSPV